MNQRKLFEQPPKPRQPRRVLMHVGDVSIFGWVRMHCKSCNHWTEFEKRSKTEAKRGIPCPRCNEAKAKKGDA